MLTAPAQLSVYRFSGVDVTVCDTNSINVLQVPPHACVGNRNPVSCGNFTVANANETTAEGYCLTSTLTATATLDLNGTSIVCVSVNINGDQQSTGTATLIVTGVFTCTSFFFFCASFIRMQSFIKFSNQFLLNPFYVYVHLCLHRSSLHSNTLLSCVHSHQLHLCGCDCELEWTTVHE